MLWSWVQLPPGSPHYEWKKYKEVADAIEEIPFDFLGDTTLTPEQREEKRKEYCLTWEKVCLKHGVTVQEFDEETEKRVYEKH